jgi:RNA polymerase sigma-70 factor (ECF subfamily)
VGPTRHNPKYASLTDQELVEAVAEDFEAFGELVRRHQDFVYGAALRVVRNPVVAQDLAQETFVRAYRALSDFRGQAQVRSWLYRIATNLALNAVTRRREFPTDEIPERRAPSEPERQAELAELRKHLTAVIEALPDDLREPLVLRELRGMSYLAIAEELGLPLNTVRTRILRARRSLRTELEEWR